MTQKTLSLPGLEGPLAPFLRTVGLQELDLGDGRAAVQIEFDPVRHANGLGVAHGGLICTLLDVVMGYAAYGWSGNPGPIVTVNQNVQFISAMRGQTTARGHVVRGGASMVFCSGEVLDASGACIATAQGVFKKVATNRGGRFDMGEAA